MKKLLTVGLLALALPAAANATVGFTGHFTSGDSGFYAGEAFGGILDGKVLAEYFIGDQIFDDSGPMIDIVSGSQETVGYGGRADYDHDVTISFNRYTGSDQQLVGTTGDFSYYSETILEGDGDGVATFTASAPMFPGQSAPSVPEAATWAMLMVGFGAVGAMMRRARRGAQPNAATYA